ncbi:MAG: 23S rRNA (adenine(2030)-N(6))-methyltransferase RlmJ [Proteobacteria bacterium]|nr:23S rRNA (adenine(2030)-N(6))-methyltransferase RlmJ [Pseudomonadota bacterium]
MLSYRHAYHAGNFADVMKHVVLTSILRYLTRKDAALCYLDTHAGAGGYDLRSDHTQKTGESGLGIAKIFDVRDAPAAVVDYLELVRRFNPTGDLSRYPGSPWFASEVLRRQDRLVLCELHTSDFPPLEQLFEKDKRVYCHAEDGYRFSLGLIPPIERRGLVLIDPAYELQDEYATAFTTLAKLQRQFAGGTFALWYPILDESQSHTFRQQFKDSPMRDVLHIALRITDRKSLPGMYGSGMIVVNPPWTLRAEMESALPWLASKLGLNRGATSVLEQWVDE